MMMKIPHTALCHIRYLQSSCACSLSKVSYKCSHFIEIDLEPWGDPQHNIIYYYNLFMLHSDCFPLPPLLSHPDSSAILLHHSLPTVCPCGHVSSIPAFRLPKLVFQKGMEMELPGLSDCLVWISRKKFGIALLGSSLRALGLEKQFTNGLWF